MGKSTISMAIFNSYVKLPEGIMGIYYSRDKIGISANSMTWSLGVSGTDVCTLFTNRIASLIRIDNIMIDLQILAYCTLFLRQTLIRVAETYLVDPAPTLDLRVDKNWKATFKKI